MVVRSSSEAGIGTDSEHLVFRGELRAVFHGGYAPGRAQQWVSDHEASAIIRIRVAHCAAAGGAKATRNVS